MNLQEEITFAVNVVKDANVASERIASLGADVEGSVVLFDFLSGLLNKIMENVGDIDNILDRFLDDPKEAKEFYFLLFSKIQALHKKISLLESILKTKEE